MLRGGRLKVVHRGIRGGKSAKFSVHNWKVLRYRTREFTHPAYSPGQEICKNSYRSRISLKTCHNPAAPPPAARARVPFAPSPSLCCQDILQRASCCARTGRASREAAVLRSPR